MPLIVTLRHRPDDLEHWRRAERVDALTARRLAGRLRDRAAEAREVLRAFITGAPTPAAGGYLGVSWGKDSVVVAHLLHELEREGIRFPAVWVRVRLWENPDCDLVRDAFLERWPLSAYEEIEVDAGEDRAGGTSALGFEEAARRHGDRHVSGVRGAESATRRIVMARWGAATARTCRPIGRWSTEEVFAYLHAHDLPVHPAYGYTMGGVFDRLRLRTASLGGARGAGHGRAGWERAYYDAALRAAGAPDHYGR